MGALLGGTAAGVMVACRTLSRLLCNVAISLPCGETFHQRRDPRPLEADLMSDRSPLRLSPRKLSEERRTEPTGSFAALIKRSATSGGCPLNRTASSLERDDDPSNRHPALRLQRASIL